MTIRKPDYVGDDYYGFHDEHGTWEAVGRCVYCACGQRLYYGTAPSSPVEQTVMAGALNALIKNSIVPVKPDNDGESVRGKSLGNDVPKRRIVRVKKGLL